MLMNFRPNFGSFTSIEDYAMNKLCKMSNIFQNCNIMHVVSISKLHIIICKFFYWSSISLMKRFAEIFSDLEGHPLIITKIQKDTDNLEVFLEILFISWSFHQSLWCISYINLYQLSKISIFCFVLCWTRMLGETSLNLYSLIFGTRPTTCSLQNMNETCQKLLAELDAQSETGSISY